jgi:hypothetical protein
LTVKRFKSTWGSTTSSSIKKPHQGSQLLYSRGNGAGLEAEILEMLDKGFQILSGERLEMGSAVMAQKGKK